MFKGKFEDLILYEDDTFIIVNKPPFLATLEDRSANSNLLHMAREYHTDAQVCHRLDKETSGLLVIAKTNDTYKYFSKLLANREVTKVYHALVDGRHEIDEQEIDTPLYSSSNKTRVDYAQGKPSITLISTLEIYKQHTLLACMPFTGRMHQIRVHLASKGLPICGDEMYGGLPIYLSHFKRKFKIAKFEEEQPIMRRMSLHASGLHFPKENGEILKITAPYPKDFHVTIRQLEKNR
ncbi:MAG: RluA family pseudouridine synthase [Cyclobacteriaceae bacterium]